MSTFEAQIVLLELRSIRMLSTLHIDDILIQRAAVSAGFNCVLHVHAAQEEVTFAALLHKLEKGEYISNEIFLET